MTHPNNNERSVSDKLVGRRPPGTLSRIIPGLMISVAALAILLYFVDARQLLLALQLADYSLIVLSLAITVIWLMVRTLVWRTLLEEKASLSQVFLTLNEGYLLNNVLPFRLGEVGRAFLLSRKASLKFLQVLSTIVIERSLDIFMAAGLLLASLPFVVGASWSIQAALVAGGLVVAGLVVLYLLARNQDWTINQFERLAVRWPVLLRVGRNHLDAFFNGLAALKDGKRFLYVVAWMILNWIVAIAQYYTLLLAFFPGARLLWAVFSLGVMALGIAAPSSPGAVGVLELSMVGALSAFGLDPSISLAVAITAHLTNYLVTGVLGVYALFHDGFTLSGLYKNVQNVSSSDPGRE